MEEDHLKIAKVAALFVRMPTSYLNTEIFDKKTNELKIKLRLLGFPN